MNRDIKLERLKYAVTQRVNRQLAESLRYEESIDIITDALVQRLAVDVLAEQLPPQAFDATDRFTVPRFASWWQQFKATYVGRWFIHYPRDFGWMRPVRFVDEPHTHVVTVNVRDRWTYPSATTVAPGGMFGHVVLKSSADRSPLDWRNDGPVHPW